MIAKGDRVKVKNGCVGEGFEFTVSEVIPGHFKEQQVYGEGNYGPVRLTEIERVYSTDALRYAGGDAQFARWLEKADAYCQKKTGILGIFDMPDRCWRDAFDSEADPEQEVDEMLEEEGYPID